MAPKAPHETEEGIIELFDIVDAAEDAPKDEPVSPQPDAERPEEAQADAAPEEEVHVVSRYPFENGRDFLDDLEGTPELTAPPSPTDTDPAAKAKGDADDASENAAPEEPDEALIRAFEEEMAKAAPGDAPSFLSPASPVPEGKTPDGFSRPEEKEAPEAAHPLLLTEEVPQAGDSLAAERPEAAARETSPPSEPLPSARCGAQSPLPAESLLSPARADEGTEERITRLEDALSRLNERVAALEQRLDETGADLAEETLSDLEALRMEKRALGDETRSLAAALAPAPESVPSEPASSDPASPPRLPSAFSCEPSEEAEDGPDTLALALEAVLERVSVLERRPVAAPDVAGIAQDVLALVRVDMEKAAEEQEAVKRTVEEVRRRVQELEKRPLPQLILPDLPDEEAVAASVMQSIRGDLDRIAAEAAARVLREEIARLMGK